MSAAIVAAQSRRHFLSKSRAKIASGRWFVVIKKLVQKIFISLDRTGLVK